MTLLPPAVYPVSSPTTGRLPILLKWVAEQVCPNHEEGDESRIFQKYYAERGQDDELTFFRCIQDIWQRPEYAENFVVKLAKRRMDDYERKEAAKS